MKRTILFLAFAVMTLIPATAQNGSVETDIQMYSQVWDDILNSGDINKINDQYFADNITLVSSPENIVGIEDFKAYYQNFLTGFSNIEFKTKDIFGQDNKIVKHWHFKGKHTGDFFGIPATGRLVDMEGVTLVKMKDGKIAREHDFMDSMVFMRQLGLLSNPENLSVIDELYKAFAAGDIPAALSMMDANIVWNEAEGNALADGNPYVGPDAVLNGVFARLGADHEYFNLKDIKLHEMSNDQVLATLRYNAKVKKNSNMYDAQAAHLFTLKNGKIVAFQQYTDTRKLDEAFRD
jgi:uncharacterized protein